jgi:predicted Zn-ribbon and HTH transcriptional regulator
MHFVSATVGDEKKPIGMVMLPGCRCRCGHEWLPRDAGERPHVCPKCKSPRWDKEKLYERKTKAKKP